MEDRLKELMQELGNAINESLSDSDRIAAAIGEIKHAGYDVFLVLEATIGFNKREDAGDEQEEPGEEVEFGESELEIEPPPLKRKFSSSSRFKWTSQDHKFLKALKISAEEEQR